MDIYSVQYDRCSIRGSNPGPPAHKTGALPTAPMELNTFSARCGDRTHDLRIMRPTRCQLRQSCVFHMCSVKHKQKQKHSGDTGFRSRCLVLAKHVLFRLSYIPVAVNEYKKQKYNYCLICANRESNPGHTVGNGVF